MSLGWVGNSTKKKKILHEFRSIESNFWSIEPSRKWTVIFCNYSIPTLQSNLDFKFWSWFANITHWSSNTFKPKVLEPNNYEIVAIFFFYMIEIIEFEFPISILIKFTHMIEITKFDIYIYTHILFFGEKHNKKINGLNFFLFLTVL